MKNSFFRIASFFILSLFMANCQKTATPPQEEEEEIIDAMFMALDEDAPSFECGEGGPEPISTFYKDEIYSVSCYLKIFPSDSSLRSKKSIGIIIKNKAAFDKYFTCSNVIQNIDFENYFVIAGYYRHSSPPGLREKGIILCDNKIVFKINLGAGISTVPGSILIWTVIERKFINKEILIDMRLI